MAEFVEFRAEEMIPELEQMERLHLLEKHEVRNIMKRRKDYEYKLQRRTKCKEDYLSYIQFEMDVLKLIRIRREKMGITQKKGDIEYAIANRVNKLFKHMLFRFQDDVKLWISYIKFCKSMGFYSAVSPMLVRMLQVHGDKPHFWKLAAKWEYEENHSIENARQFFLRGLRFHPESHLLYTEAFQLELAHAQMLQQQKKNEESEEQRQAQEETNEQEMDGGAAEVMYMSARRKIQDVHFIVSMLKIAQGFEFTKKIQDAIVNDLLAHFPKEKLTWDMMAQRELNGFPFTIPGTPESMDGKAEKPCLKERIRRCCAVYNAAVEEMKSEGMWSLYLEALLQLYQDTVHLPKYKKKLLLTALQGAHDAGLLQQKFYLQWFDILKSDDKPKKLGEILREATERLPMSIELWQYRLDFLLTKLKEQEAVMVFESTIAHLGDIPECLPLWKKMIEFYQTKSVAKVEQYFQRSLLCASAISIPLKAMYIEWITLTKGIGAARKLYTEISMRPPLCLELHQKMAAMENMQPVVNLKQTRKCYELACDQFGKNNTDVWMEYVKFELRKGSPENVANIYHRAMKSLDQVESDLFASEFSLLKTGIVNG